MGMSSSTVLSMVSMLRPSQRVVNCGPRSGGPPIDRVAEEVVPVAEGALLLVDLLSASGLLHGIDAA